MSSSLRLLSVVALLAVCCVAVADAAPRSTRHPEAPPETAQFEFLLGEWDCAIRTMTPDGALGPARDAKWSAEYILDGWAIQDTWVSALPDGSDGYGTNIRSFNPETQVWDNRWLSGGSLQWKYYSAEKVGDTMVMTGGEGSDPRGDFVDRNTFHSFTPTSWEWRKDRSYDGGETWIEGIATISAKKAGS